MLIVKIPYVGGVLCDFMVMLNGKFGVMMTEVLFIFALLVILKFLWDRRG